MPRGRAVIAPQALGGLVQESVDVLGDDEVCREPRDLEDAAALALERPVYRDPDALDEEVLAEDHRDDALVLGHAPGRRAEVKVPVVARATSARHLEVVLEHEALRGGHRGLGLVLVRALCQRQQARDALDDLALERLFRSGSGIPDARASIPSRAQASRKALPWGVSSVSPSVSWTYWCAISCLSTSTTAPQGRSTTSGRDISMVRVSGTHRPRVWRMTARARSWVATGRP